ncbi:MAG: Urea transporter, substrate binding protein UrtA, partial [Acidobacteria bacterium]|nr:Urea transporter, substrate binding protein UrtA [Acidobacteriota bacterium]
MSNQVLIIAPGAAARQPAEIARSLQFAPVVASTEDEAIALLESQRFNLITVSGHGNWHRVRELAERKHPMTRVMELPPPDVDDDDEVRRMMIQYLDRTDSEARPRFSEERYRFLSGILESFTATLDLQEVLRRIVTVTREEFNADRAWLLHPISEQAEYAKIAFSVNGPGCDAGEEEHGPVPLAGSQALIHRALESTRPVVVLEGDPELDPELAGRFKVRSEMVQILRTREGEPWAFGIHQCTTCREWTEEEVVLFGEISRYATLALNNTLLHARAVREMAKVNAILDQIPESAAIYDAAGKLERMNAAALREPSQLFTQDPEGRVRTNRHRYIDGSPLSTAELPSMRAIRGESVKSDYLVHDLRSDDDRVVNLKAAPIRDDGGRIIGSVVLSRDVTDERQNAERESWRRRRAECLANLGLEQMAMQPAFDDLDDLARRVAGAVAGTVRIFLYHNGSGLLDLVGFASALPEVEGLRKYFLEHPYRPGEGLVGTAFQIGRPLLFFEIRGDAVLGFARDEEERQVKIAMHEQSLIACPIETYGERIGSLVISQADPRRNFDAEDLEFAQSIAERIAAASHIHRLTRMSLEGHRAAEELARREVDARVRFEAVIENAPVGIAVISADELRFELANARFLEFSARYGNVPPDEKIVGLHIADVVAGFEQALRQVAESGEATIDEAIEIASRPTPTYFNRIISAVRGRFSGITQSLTVLLQDVTDQVRAKREIEALAQMMAERSARLDSILGSMADGLWVYDANAGVVDVNQAALTMFGLASRTEAVQHGSFDQFHLRYPDGRAVPPDDLPFARALRGQTVPDYLAIGRHLITGKDLDLSIAAAPIESNGIVGAVLVMRDITALQELDRKKDEFLSVASHELRTPLTTIKGYTQLLAQTVNDSTPEERGTYLTAVLGEIDRMMGLISELLDVSRIETNRLQIHPQPIRWREFLERRAGAFRVQNPARNIRFDLTLDEVIVHADPDRMRQVIDNLLSNATKYSPEGSDIDVTANLEDGSLLTSVIDHGIGIPRDEIPQLFERFHRARNVSSRYYGGLGLGLYIARAIVEAHQGLISVESEEGDGS